MNRSILRRRGRRKVKKDFELPLTSMMDMLIILLVFLLKSYSTSAVSFTTSDNITLPSSRTPEEPTEGMNVMIEPAHLEDGKADVVPGAIILEGNRVVEFTDKPVPIPMPVVGSQSGETHLGIDPAGLPYELPGQALGDEGRRILPLYDALVKEKDKVEYLRSTQKFEKTIVDQKTGDAETKPVPAPKFNGTLIIHADKTVQYQLLRKVMYTAAAAEFKTFKLVTVKKEDEASPPKPDPAGAADPTKKGG